MLNLRRVLPSDKVEKSRLIRQIKLAEIGVMTCGVIALWMGSMPMMIGALFLMGTQSAFFGPVKYAILRSFSLAPG